MTLGAICVALACFAALNGIRETGRVRALAGRDLIRASTLSPVEWRMQQQDRASWYQRWLRPLVRTCARRLHVGPLRLDPMFFIQAGLNTEEFDGTDLRTIRLMAAVAGCALGLLLGTLTGVFLIIPLIAWIGWVAPLRALAARRRRRQARIMSELPQFVGMVRAFLGSGMSLEHTLHILTQHKTGDNPLTHEIRHALGRYGLGVSIERALEEVGARTGVDDLQMFMTALNQNKRAGSGLDTVLRDLELMIRMNQRNRVTAQAAAVSTKLLAVLAGVYLPEFAILIVVPLFWGIMQRAFG